uniref:Uncharacterized protein n=1 Tax=Picea sitchensis TaxID=3332 RepID=D5ADW1_PICSI|nr:unknown [Picea sitchensis]
MMKDVGLKKKPGFSWIEVKNKVHTFVVGDRSHPQTGDLCRIAATDRVDEGSRACA